MEKQNIKIKLYGNITARKYDSIDELFQRKKFNELINIFNHNLKMNIDDKMPITNTRTHDTIFVSGDRGSGKTAFMLNIESYIKEKNQDLHKKLKFFTPIDPTLLEDTESFLSVVLAKLVEEINNHLKTSNDDNLKREYFEILQQLSESLKAIKTLKDDKGIDEITSNKSSLKLEENAHKFFGLVCKIFKVKRLVVLIDDVDMAFERGFDVLEVVRKYLASPYLIPIVAGDYDLYEKIVKNYFMNKTEFDKEIDIIDKCYDNKLEKYLKQKVFVDNLTEQYLQKVFPSEYRVILDDIKSIVDKEKVEVSISENDEIDFQEIKKFEINHINLGINREAYKYNPISYNARLFVQYLTRKKDIYEEFLIKNKDYNDINNLQKSYEITSEFYKFSIDDKKRFLSQLLRNDVDSFEDSKYNLYRAFSSEYFRGIKDNKDELYNDNIIKKLIKDKKSDTYKITKTDLNKIIIKSCNTDQCNINNYMMALFIFNDYYTSYQTRNYIFIGKFLSHMIFSLNKYEIRYKKNKKEESKETNGNTADNNGLIKKIDILEVDFLEVDKIYSNFWEKNNEIINNISIATNDIKNELKNIVNDIPFGSEFITKKNDLYSYDEANEDDDKEVEIKFELENYTKQLLIWQKEFLPDNIELNSLSLYEISLKILNNFVELKKKSLKDENVANFFKRMILILINAVAYFEKKDNDISNTNFAMSDSFDLKTILDKTPASFKNIKPLFETEEKTLTKALFYHPLISYILSIDENDYLYKLKFVNKKANKKVSKKKSKFEIELRKYIRPFNLNKISKIDEENKQKINEFLDIVIKFIEKNKENKEDFIKILNSGNNKGYLIYKNLKKLEQNFDIELKNKFQIYEQLIGK